MATRSEPHYAPFPDEAPAGPPQALAVHGAGQELQSTAAFARAQAEIQAAIVIAKKYPRDETAAYQKLMRSAERNTFAEDCVYNFPRGEARVIGPSVIMAREAARIWGNLRYGLVVLREDEDARLIRGWAWDLESNAYCEADDEFQKKVQRKVGSGRDRRTEWVTPDERDLRELTNRRGAILVRNCLLQLIPKDFIDDCISKADRTLEGNVKNDPDAWKRIVSAFSEINVTVNQLVAYLGKSVASCSPAELAKLRQIYKSVSDGNSTWEEYAGVPMTADGAGAAIGAKTETVSEELKAQLKKKMDEARAEYLRANGPVVNPQQEPAAINREELKTAAQPDPQPQSPAPTTQATATGPDEPFVASDDDVPDNIGTPDAQAQPCASPTGLFTEAQHKGRGRR